LSIPITTSSTRLRARSAQGGPCMIGPLVPRRLALGASTAPASRRHWSNTQLPSRAEAVMATYSLKADVLGCHPFAPLAPPTHEAYLGKQPVCCSRHARSESWAISIPLPPSDQRPSFIAPVGLECWRGCPAQRLEHIAGSVLADGAGRQAPPLCARGRRSDSQTLLYGVAMRCAVQPKGRGVVLGEGIDT
jgi:hypothetical protein